MNPQELRIGNLLVNKQTGAFLKVSDITEDGFTSTVIDRSLFPLPAGWQAEPIPLTPEILEAAGFVKNLDNFWNDKGFEIGVLFHDEGVTVCTNSIVRPVKYLHQLQNLYFTLTGTELEINMMQKA